MKYFRTRGDRTPVSAAAAIVCELRHLGRLCVEVICRALWLPVEKLAQPQADALTLLPEADAPDEDVDALYQQRALATFGMAACMRLMQLRRSLIAHPEAFAARLQAFAQQAVARQAEVQAQRRTTAAPAPQAEQQQAQARQ